MAFYRILYSGGYLVHHGIKDQKWGVRNGPPYPLNSEALAGILYSQAKEKEPKISEDITAAAKLSGSKLYGFEHRLKTKDSLQRKIETKAKEDFTTKSKAADRIFDAVRYTTISDNNNFVANYEKMKDILSSEGYKEVRCKNNFIAYKQGKVKHKSVQSVFKDPDGYKFEIQFQTPQSQKVKDKKVPLYEERRQLGVNKERANEIEKEMVRMAESIPYPKDINKIKSH